MNPYLLLSAPSVGLSSFAQNEKPAPIHAIVPYGHHVRQVFDIWIPDSDKPTPFVLYIHGGGYFTGSKENLNANVLNNLLAAKIAVVAVNYRLYQQALLPTTLQD